MQSESKQNESNIEFVEAAEVHIYDMIQDVISSRTEKGMDSAKLNNLFKMCGNLNTVMGALLNLYDLKKIYGVVSVDDIAFGRARR